MVAMLICFTMLMGTTFAWFTDSVVSANNIIQTGSLNIELEYLTDEGWMPVDATTSVFSDTLWEPGHTETVYLRMTNHGSLALKYNLGIYVASETAGINVNGDRFKLSEYIEFGIVNDRSEKFEDRNAARAAVKDSKPISAGYEENGELIDTDDVKYIAMVVFMPEEVGNEANSRTGSAAATIDLGINLFATQTVKENDSFDDQYDANAPEMYTVNGVSYSSASEAMAAAKDGDKAVFVCVKDPIVVDKAIELTVSNANIEAPDGKNAITVTKDTTLIIESGNVLIGGKGASAVKAEGAKLTVTGKGSLTAKGNGGVEDYSSGGSGIYGDADSAIIIDGLASLIAEGYGKKGFGIGGATKTVTVNNTNVIFAKGGMVQAVFSEDDDAFGSRGNEGAPAIGSSTDRAVITINNSVIANAVGGSKAAGIGALFHTGVTINITDSDVTALGGTGSAGIGGSRVYKYADLEADAITITVTNSKINAKGGQYGAGIGAGYDKRCHSVTTAPKTTITIDASSNVTAEGGKLAAGIGTGHNVVNLEVNVECDTSNVKAGDPTDECCNGAEVSAPEAVGYGALNLSIFPQ